MPDLPAPQLSRRVQVPLIWIVPLVALGIAVWMVQREWRQRGPEITIQFRDGTGVQAGQTSLRYKGVNVGTVTGVQLDDDLEHVLVHVRLRREAAGLARRDSQFWIVYPRIGFSGISGLETIIAGVHLNVQPGGGPRASRFVGREQPPARPGDGEGRTFRLMTERLGTMHAGAPVYYRDFQVGEVESIHLRDDARSVVVRVRIEPAYTALVRPHSRFWNAGGVPLQVSLFGAQLDTASLRAFFTGAISFATPDTFEEPAPEGMAFELHASPEDEWLEWSPRIPITVPEETGNLESKEERPGDETDGRKS